MNPRQYAATIDDLPQVEVWLQRASDIVRRIRAGDIDVGILGNDMGARRVRSARRLLHGVAVLTKNMCGPRSGRVRRGGRRHHRHP